MLYTFYYNEMKEMFCWKNNFAHIQDILIPDA